MTRRFIIAFVFALLGFASLLVANFTYTWTCQHFANFCRVYTGPCPGIDTCKPDTLLNLALVAVYFGPPIVFGIVGFVYSKKPRSVWSWLGLTVGLVALHSVIMMVGIQGTTR